MRYSEKDLNVQQIKSIQRITGNANVPDTGAGGGGSHSTRSTDVTISAVDTDKTFLIVESYMVGGYWWQWATGGNDTQMRFDAGTNSATLTNSTTVRVYYGQSHNYNQPTASWSIQIVEYV